MHEQYLMMKKVGQHLLKGVVMFMILNIDVADKNPKYKSQEHQTEADAEPTPHSNDGTNTNDDAKQGEKGTKDNTGNTPAGDTSGNSTTATKTQPLLIRVL